VYGVCQLGWIAFGLDMERDVAGPGLGEGIDHRRRVGHHQVHVQERLGHGPVNGRAHCRPHGQVRHEVAVHHVQVQQLRPAGQDGPTLLTQAGEVSSQDRRGDQREARRVGQERRSGHGSCVSGQPQRDRD